MQSETSTTALLAYLRALLATYEMVHNRLKDDTQCRVITRQALANSCCHSLAMSPFEDIYPTSLVRALFQACPCSFLKWRNALEVWHCLLEPANRVVLWSLLDLCSFSQEGLEFLPQQPRTRLHFSWLNVVLKRPQLNRNLNTVACNSVPINDCSTRIVQTLTILVASRTSIYRLAPGKIHLQKDKWQWFEMNTSPC